MGKHDKRQSGKIRTEFRKKHESRTRQRDLTRGYAPDEFDGDSLTSSERLTGKGELTRKRTIIGATADDESGFGVRLAVDASVCLSGRVLGVRGLLSDVRTDDGRVFRCATRRLLKSLSTDQRHIVVAGDRVQFRPEGQDAGIIERIEPRHGVLSRTSRNRQHVIVANVDQVLIVSSAAQPDLKPNLIDRLFVTCERTRLRPILVINKIDLVDAADLQPLAGVYGQMGYDVLLASARTGFGIARLRSLLEGCETALVGQSGVGKSSLLNAIEPGLGLRVREVSEENEKGKHTTTTAELLPLSFGGYVVDTPGVRQFQLWDVIPAEVAGFFRDLSPYVSHCRFPNCTHTHEHDCAVKNAVADGRLDTRRYESYCQIAAGDE